MRLTAIDIAGLIPEETDDEALGAIQTIVTLRRGIQMSVHLSSKFVLFAYSKPGLAIEIVANKRMPVRCAPVNFLAVLRREIYNIDEAIACGSYKQSPRTPAMEIRPPMPVDMDLPTWDAETGTWYDAEY